MRIYSSGGRILTALKMDVSGGKATALVEEGEAKRTIDLGPLDATLADVFVADVWVGRNPAIVTSSKYYCRN